MTKPAQCRNAPVQLSPGIHSGYGRAFASFGEIAQGRRADGEDFLVTLPVDLWSRCQLTLTPRTGRSLVHSPLDKARAVAKWLLREFDLTAGWRLELSLQRDMPVGKGLSSSTADMLAVVRAFEHVFGLSISHEVISACFAAIEPHDALHYPASVFYNHRRGTLLHAPDYTPDFCIVGGDAGGELSTRDYNRQLVFSTEQLLAYDQLYAALLAAFRRRDDVAIARCASRSAGLQLARTGNPLLSALLAKAASCDALGVIATHSGTCAGLLLAGNTIVAKQRAVAAQLAQLSCVRHVFTTLSLRRLPEIAVPR